MNMSKFTKMFEIAFAKSNSDKTSLLEKESTKTILGSKYDQFKTLIQSNAIQSANLLQEEVYKTISEGAEPYKCLREVLPVIKTDTYSVRVVKGEVGSYAEEVAEGAKVPIDTQIYSKQDIVIKKTGTRPLITNELIEDCLFDIAQLELSKAGARMENKLNRDCLAEMLGDQGCTAITPAGTHSAIADLVIARNSVQAYNYMPDTFLTHPTAEGYYLADSNLIYASYFGSPAVLTTGKMPKIFGMTPHTLSVTTGDAALNWDGTVAATHWNALVFDSKATAYLAMRRDLTVEQYDDPIHDILGIACTMRYGVEVIRNTAQCAILAK
jgi:hypothetical protein